MASETNFYMGKERCGRVDGALVRIAEVSFSCLASQTGCRQGASVTFLTPTRKIPESVLK